MSSTWRTWPYCGSCRPVRPFMPKTALARPHPPASYTSSLPLSQTPPQQSCLSQAPQWGAYLPKVSSVQLEFLTSLSQ